jgi:hypothetical protein
MLSGEIIERETFAGVSRVPVTKEDITSVAQVLRAGGMSSIARVRTAGELAGIVRLQAAANLKLGDRLDVFDGSVLAAAIATAPLHEISGYYYFDPEQLLAHAAAHGAVWGIEVSFESERSLLAMAP